MGLFFQKKRANFQLKLPGCKKLFLFNKIAQYIVLLSKLIYDLVLVLSFLDHITVYVVILADLPELFHLKISMRRQLKRLFLTAFVWSLEKGKQNYSESCDNMMTLILQPAFPLPNCCCHGCRLQCRTSIYMSLCVYSEGIMAWLNSERLKQSEAGNPINGKWLPKSFRIEKWKFCNLSCTMAEPKEKQFGCSRRTTL